MLGLQNAQEHHVCIMTVGVVSEIARALERKLSAENGRALCDDIMHALLHNLQDPLIERSVKPHIISCLSDIALAVGGYFERYLPFVMMMLVQASQIKLDQSDYDNHDYINQLREAVLEAYTGILQGLAGDNQEHIFLQFCPSVLSFLEIIAGDSDREENVLRAAVGVVGDLGSRLGDKLGQEIKRPAVPPLPPPSPPT
jgi:importin subunit beta-1